MSSIQSRSNSSMMMSISSPGKGIGSHAVPPEEKARIVEYMNFVLRDDEHLRKVFHATHFFHKLVIFLSHRICLSYQFLQVTTAFSPLWEQAYFLRNELLRFFARFLILTILENIFTPFSRVKLISRRSKSKRP